MSSSCSKSSSTYAGLSTKQEHYLDSEGSHHANKDTMSSHAFAIVELLEIVLMHLEMKDLLRIQRVSQQWRTVITTSPNLLRRMFLGFVPKTGKLSQSVYDNNSKPESACHAPITSKGVPGRHLLNGTSDVRPAFDQSPQHIQFNPVFPSDGRIVRLRTAQFRAKLDCKESWLDMFFTQDPCTEMQVGLYFIRKREWMSRFGLIRRSDEPVVLTMMVRRDTGVRARDILESLRRACSEDVQRWQRIDICAPGAANA